MLNRRFRSLIREYIHKQNEEREIDLSAVAAIMPAHE